MAGRTDGAGLPEYALILALVVIVALIVIIDFDVRF